MLPQVLFQRKTPTPPRPPAAAPPVDFTPIRSPGIHGCDFALCNCPNPLTFHLLAFSARLVLNASAPHFDSPGLSLGLAFGLGSVFLHAPSPKQAISTLSILRKTGDEASIAPPDIFSAHSVKTDLSPLVALNSLGFAG